MKKIIIAFLSFLIFPTVFTLSPIFSTSSECSDKDHGKLENIQSAGEIKFLYVPELDNEIGIFRTVWVPWDKDNNVLRKVLSNNDLSWAKNVLDVGTGCGILGLIALKRGAGRVVGTDINPAAVDNVRYNAKKLGYAGIFEARLVKKNDPTAYSVINKKEKFDLIISDPPWNEGKPSHFEDYAKFDYNRVLLRSFIKDLKPHLTKIGKAWLYLGDKDAIALVFELAPKSGLKAVIIDRYSNQSREYAVIELTRI